MIKKLLIICSILNFSLLASQGPEAKVNLEANGQMAGAGSSLSDLMANSECPVCFDKVKEIDQEQAFVTGCCDQFMCKGCGTELIDQDKELKKNLEDPAWRKVNGENPFPKLKGCPLCREVPLRIVSYLFVQKFNEVMNDAIADIGGENFDQKVKELYEKLHKLPTDLQNIIIAKWLKKEFSKNNPNHQELVHTNITFNAKFSHDGTYLVSQSFQNPVILSIKNSDGTFSPLQELMHEKEALDKIEFSYDSEFIVTTSNNWLYFWKKNPDNRFKIGTKQKIKNRVKKICFSQDNEFLFVLFMDGKLLISRRNYEKNQICENISDFFVTSDSQSLIGLSNKKIILAHRDSNGIFNWCSVPQDYNIDYINVSQTGKYLVASSAGNNTIFAWEKIDNGTYELIMTGKQPAKVEFSSDDQFVGIISQHGIVIATKKDKNIVPSIQAMIPGAMRLYFSPNSQFHAQETINKIFLLEKTEHGIFEVQNQFEKHGALQSFDFNQDCQCAVTHHAHKIIIYNLLNLAISNHCKKLESSNLHLTFISALAAIALKKSQFIQGLQALAQSHFLKYAHKNIQELIKSIINARIKALEQAEHQKKIKEEEESLQAKEGLQVQIDAPAHIKIAKRSSTKAGSVYTKASPDRGNGTVSSPISTHPVKKVPKTSNSHGTDRLGDKGAGSGAGALLRQGFEGQAGSGSGAGTELGATGVAPMNETEDETEPKGTKRKEPSDDENQPADRGERDSKRRKR